MAKLNFSAAVHGSGDATGSVSDLMAIGDTTLSETQIAEVCADILLGLCYLHEQKLIHRVRAAWNLRCCAHQPFLSRLCSSADSILVVQDLKPGNVLITRDGHAKLGA